VSRRRPTPLQRVSSLVGVEVTGVRRCEWRDGQGWALRLADGRVFVIADRAFEPAEGGRSHLRAALVAMGRTRPLPHNARAKLLRALGDAVGADELSPAGDPALSRPLDDELSPAGDTLTSGNGLEHQHRNDLDLVLEALSRQVWPEDESATVVHLVWMPNDPFVEQGRGPDAYAVIPPPRRDGPGAA